jgi:hypothetical protein
MLFAFCVIAFAMMLGRGAMGFGGVLVMLRCLTCARLEPLDFSG